MWIFRVRALSFMMYGSRSAPRTNLQRSGAEVFIFLAAREQVPGAVVALGLQDSHFGCEIAELPGLMPAPPGGGGALV